MKIQLTQTTYTRSNECKSWQEKVNSTEKREISLNEYELLTNDDTIKFFRRLGGKETIKRNYTLNGFCIVYLSSISPDNQLKVVRKFKFNN